MVRLFKRGKEKVKEHVAKVEITDLEKVCGEDKKVCDALWHTMFYDPRKIHVTLEDAAKKAVEFERDGDNEKARMWYHIAGGLALWKGDVAGVKQYFGKCAALAPDMDYKAITKIPEKAVEKAQEFYSKFLK